MMTHAEQTKLVEDIRRLLTKMTPAKQGTFVLLTQAADCIEQLEKQLEAMTVDVFNQ